MSDVVKIQLGERVRECKLADLAVFEKQGYKRVGAEKPAKAEPTAAPKKRARKTKIELIAPAALSEAADGNDDQ